MKGPLSAVSIIILLLHTDLERDWPKYWDAADIPAPQSSDLIRWGLAFQEREKPERTLRTAPSRSISNPPPPIHPKAKQGPSLPSHQK